MAMFSGCYLVFCGNEIVGQLIATLRLWRPPWPLLGTRTTAAGGLKPTDCLEIKRLPESAASGMIGRRLEEDSWLRTFTPPREATLRLEGRFTQEPRFGGKWEDTRDALLNQINGRRRKSMKLELRGKKRKKQNLKEKIPITQANF